MPGRQARKNCGDRGLPLRRFSFRLSGRDPDDRRLSQLMASDIESGGVNLSIVVRQLLLRWYERREATGDMSISSASSVLLRGDGFDHQDVVEGREDPNDELVQRLLGISANEWEK